MRRGGLVAAACLLLVGVGHAEPAHAWGHLNDFGVKDFSGSLIFDLLDEGSVGYCVASEDSRYNEADLSVLVEASLGVWLDAVRDLIGDSVVVEEDCQPSTVDLLILFRRFDGVRSPDGVADIAFRGRVQRGANFFSVIGFNTVGTNAARGRPLVFMSPLDFLVRNVDRNGRLAFLRAVSKVAPGELFGRRLERMAPVFRAAASDLAFELQSVEAVVLARAIQDNPIDIFPVMIHEFGHGFGLCDMRPAPYEVSCDPDYRTLLARDSLMAFGGYRLRDDDVAGIRALFERFVRRPFLDPRVFGDDDRRASDRFDSSLVTIDRPAEGPAIGFFAGDCRTVVTAAQVLLPGGERAAEPRAAFTVRQMGGEAAADVDWAASGYAALDRQIALSHRAPEDDYFVLRLVEPVAGCVPLVIDKARADAVIEATGAFSVVSVGSYGPNGRVDAGGALVQDSASCTMFRRDFGNKFYQDPLTFLTDCDLTRGNAGSPVIHEAGDKRYLLGMAVGADRLPQSRRRGVAYRVTERPDTTFDPGPTFRGREGDVAGANIFVRLNGAFLASLQQVTD